MDGRTRHRCGFRVWTAPKSLEPYINCRVNDREILSRAAFVRPRLCLAEAGREGVVRTTEQHPRLGPLARGISSSRVALLSLSAGASRRNRGNLFWREIAEEIPLAGRH